MKILLVILTTLIILISVFLINLSRDVRERKEKRDKILTPRIFRPKTRSVSFAKDVVRAIPARSPKVTPAILVDEHGHDQLLKFDAFVDNYYSQKDITKFKQIYEAEALDITNRYKTEDFLYKKESDRFQIS
jgi:hypothetical protein